MNLSTLGQGLENPGTMSAPEDALSSSHSTAGEVD